ncbi:MAG: hypothetical protein ABIY70_16225 [Capsulimonas sp.]|uniref:hypothetical protein n=1 Tax=Capsulimonas sp. TaxID=2494211 RepID=UPI003263D482
MNNRLRLVFLSFVASLLLMLTLVPAAHAGDGRGMVVVLVGGPVVVFFTLAAFAALCIFAVGINKGPQLIAIGERALDNSQGARLLHFVWGILCAIFVATAAAVFINVEMFALIGILILIAGVMLTGFGVLVSSAHLGTRVVLLLDGAPPDTLGAIRVGLPLLLLASAVPIVGSLQIIAAAAMGMGAVLEAIARRN